MLALGGPAFVLFGVILVLVGASQDVLADLLQMDLEETGLLGASVLLGVGTGVALGGPLADRFERRPLFVVACAASALALLTVAEGISLPRLIAHFFLMGFGGGLYEAVLNTRAAEYYAEASVRPLALLHSGANIGAMGGPILLRLALDSYSWVTCFRAFGALFVALAAASLFVDLGRGGHASSHGPGGSLRAAFTPTVLLLTAIAFAYIGVESGFTLFAIPFAELELGLSPMRGADAISVFWLGLLLGRIALLRAQGPATPRYLVYAGMAGAIALGACTLARIPQPELMAGAAGLALGGVFPVMIAIAGQNEAARGTSIAMVAGLGSIGGFAIPWLTGALGDTFGIAATMQSLALWCVGITIGATILLRRSAHDATA